jgi:signal peptide peptidase SppA
MHVLEAIESSAWGIEEGALERIRQVAARENDVSPEALEAYRSRSLERAERAKARGDIALLYVDGPLFRRANMMTEISGATSYDVLLRDFQAAIDNPSIRSIVLSVDSPGGEVSGCAELAAAIYSARGKKKITAYVGGQALSAAYWVVSGADEIVAADTAMLGSIGVVLGMTDTRQRDEKSGIKKIEFVSSMSPDKRLDVSTAEGQARIQRTVDELGQVFVEAVAKHRGVKAADVVSKFGRGGIEIGANAVRLGMADRLGSFESMISDLSKVTGSARPNMRSGYMSTETTPAPAANETGITQETLAKAVAEAVAKANTESRARANAILGAAGTLQTLANHLAFETDLSADAAKAILTAAASDVPKLEAIEAVAAPLNSFAQHKASLPGALAGEARQSSGENPMFAAAARLAKASA